MSRFFIILAALLISAAPLAAADTERVNDFQISSTFSQLPLYFVENQGQIDSRDVAYYVMGADKTLYFTSEGIIFALARKDGNAEKHGCVKLDFVDANPGVKPRGEEKQKAIFSYFKGTVEDWKTGIATYRRIVYENLWPGIDLVYHGDGSRLKYEFIVKPGADPERIRLTYRGVTKLCVDESGELEVTTPGASFKDGKPQAYQVLKGGKRAVSMAYELEKGEADTGTYGFEIGDYDPNETLILDPVLFVSCGYIGGYSNDFARDITVDRLGNVYIAGGTLSKENSFPVKVGPDLTYNDSYDGWVAKVNADGKSLAFCGYIGGKGHDECWSIEVDGTGSIFLVGETMSDETSFPVLGGPDLTINGQRDVFVAKLNPTGTGLVYCGYIGGDLDDHAFGIDVDHEGNAYVAGRTSSTDASFPVLVGPDLSFNGAWYNGDAFVAKVQADGASLVYCGYIGGEGRDWGQGIAVDQHGCAYVTGATNSSEVTFPVLVGPDLSHEGNDDAFIAKVKVDGTGLEYCGYIGSTEADVGYAVAVDGLGRAYVTGEVAPPCKNFPVVMGPDRTHNGGYRDAFVAKINERGSRFIYCGFIGGDDSDRGRGIAVDGWGNAYVGGVTTSSESTFPVKGGPDLTYNYKADGFVAKVRADGSQLVYCGYIGGKDDDGVSAVAVDAKGIAYVTGTTRSPETTFPVTGGPDLTQNGDLDGYVAKISPALVVDARHLSARMGGVVNFSLYAAEENKSRRYILLGGASGTEPGILLPGGAAILPLNFDYFSLYAFQMLNSPPFANFSSVLGVSGNSWAQMDTTILEPIPPGCVGLKLNFAYALNNPWDFVSNPVTIEIVP